MSQIEDLVRNGPYLHSPIPPAQAVCAFSLLRFIFEALQQKLVPAVGNETEIAAPCSKGKPLVRGEIGKIKPDAVFDLRGRPVKKAIRKIEDEIPDYQGILGALGLRQTGTGE